MAAVRLGSAERTSSLATGSTGRPIARRRSGRGGASRRSAYVARRRQPHATRRTAGSRFRNRRRLHLDEPALPPGSHHSVCSINTKRRNVVVCERPGSKRHLPNCQIQPPNRRLNVKGVSSRREFAGCCRGLRHGGGAKTASSGGSGSASAPNDPVEPNARSIAEDRRAGVAAGTAARRRGV